MKHSAAASARSPRRRYVVAMVLSTALSALGSAAVGAETSAGTARAVNDMSRYCTACWRNARLHPDSWTDCTQEVFSRLMDRVTPDAWSRVLNSEGQERREFLRAIDTVKKRTQRTRKWLAGGVAQVADRAYARHRRLAEDRQTLQEAATAILSPRQLQILQLSLDGWVVHEIATELQLSAERVSDEKYKAIRKLREHFCGVQTETAGNPEALV